MKIYRTFYISVTGERFFVKVEVTDEMYNDIKKIVFDFYNGKRTEYRRDNLATTEKIAKQSPEYAMSPENLVFYNEKTEQKERQLEALPKLRKKLPPHWARLLELYHDEGMTEVEIAKLRGVSQPAIAKQLRKIFSLLRKQLQDL